MMKMTETVKHLIIINVLFFLCANTGLIPQANNLFALYFIENPHFHWYQVVTHMFMHAPLPNVMHIAFNMFALYSFGSALEHYWGPKRFLFFYFSCGLGAALIHTLANYYFFENGLASLLSQGFQKSEVLAVLNGGNNQQIIGILNTPKYVDFLGSYLAPAVGASGAIYGLLVAFGMMFPNAELALMFIPVPIKAKYFIPILVGLDLFSGVTGFSIFGGGIAHFAHVGGALFGFIIMWFWKKNQFNQNRWN